MALGMERRNEAFEGTDAGNRADESGSLAPSRSGGGYHPKSTTPTRMKGVLMRQIVRALVGGVLLTALLATPALAQTYPLGEPTVRVSNSTMFPCDTITFTGSNFEPGSTVDITFVGVVIATATVGADGTYSVSVKIPCDTAPGTHVLGAGGTNTHITVLAAGGGGGAPGIGANLGAGILILAALMVVGVTALVATRRRVKVAQPQHVAESRSL